MFLMYDLFRRLNNSFTLGLSLIGFHMRIKGPRNGGLFYVTDKGRGGRRRVKGGRKTFALFLRSEMKYFASGKNTLSECHM